MTATERPSGLTPAFEDLTARARIRDAALQHFAEHGFARATIRGIAKAAGVSPGLVRHHFGAKEQLREACDAYVADALRRFNEQALADGRQGDLGFAAASRQALEPFQRYLARAMVDGSAAAAAMFDAMVEMTEQWVARVDETRSDPPFADQRTRAALINAMAMGIPLMHDHLSRVLGVELFSTEGNRLLGLAMLDIYSHRLLDPELAATARASFDGPTGQENGDD